MIDRVLEPEVMDTAEEAKVYDEMDHSLVNDRFVADFLEAHGSCRGGEILDVGTGTALIPIRLCQVDPEARVVALDLSTAMLERAALNIGRAGFGGRIACRLDDAKSLAQLHQAFEAVVSNSIIHHIPDPAPVFDQMSRLVAKGGTLFVRDLARPDSLAEIEHLVATYAGSEPQFARDLFGASLNAALTLDEVRRIVADLELPPESVTMTSDRHWTWSWRNDS
ncbi:class I SAM-dependent methyltransferase [Singulisphaera sp. PoT]|uniref:class I SAM-dependent methyltransferase n=1 Tax=Singulisphaera sp. PoT TaxID=3411797 RepID=UPI003BF5FC08